MNLFVVLACALFAIEGLSASPYHGLCPKLTFPNGRVRYRQRGKIARFLCGTGYMLAGERYSVCADGKWDYNMVPKCVRASCKNVKPPNNGLIYQSHAGAVLNFYCKSGYELKGANITFCDGIQWDNPLPSCLPTNSIPSLSCDFEHEDLCGWNHDLNHDFDWTRLNFATPSGSIGTGPSYDHTKGAGEDGYYMYIESSARNVNDTARLISPVFDKTYAPTCFEFWYHMHGSTTGSLRVYLKRVNEMWNLQPRNAIFIKSGNQGNRWYRGFIVLGVIDCEYQIVIEGVRGTSYVSDIAIDDVKIIQNCNPDDEIIEGETTTEDFLSSETPIIVESCENRCNTNDSRTSDWLITCDCDEGCYERSRCCPDYFDFCVSGTTADVDATTEAEVTETTKTTMKIPTPPLITTWIPKRIKTTKITVKIPTPPLLTTWTPKRVNTAKIMVKIPTPPLLTTWTPKRVKTVPTTTIKTITKVIKISTKTQPKMTYSQSTESDYKDIPRTTVMEVETPGLPIEETEIITDYESDKNFDHQKIEVKNNVHENNTKTVVFAVGVVFGVLFAMVGTTFVARRYQLCRCHRIKLNQSANGDSQSDVRFLTGEEVLDFNLDY